MKQRRPDRSASEKDDPRRRRRRQLGPALLVSVVVVSFVGSGLGRQQVARCGGPDAEEQGRQVVNAKRLVSLAPSITETVFAVGCGARLVGATRYCEHPPAAKRVDRVGGYLDPSFERIASKKPDLVVALRGPEHKRVRQYLRRMRLPLLTVDHQSLTGIVNSLEQVGRACGQPAQGRALAAKARRRLKAVADRIRGRRRPRVLIVFGRSNVAGPLREVYVAGRKGLYDDVLRRAGGDNAYPRDVPAYPKLSAEGIAKIDPELIVELAPELEKQGVTRAQLLASWQRLDTLQAVKRGGVHVLPGLFGEVPGPRFVDLVVKLSELLHPRVKGGAR